MNTVSFTNFRQSLSSYLDKTEDDCEELIVTRNKGRKTIVVNYDDYMALKETAYLLSSPKNRKHLEQSMKSYKSGKTIKLDL